MWFWETHPEMGLTTLLNDIHVRGTFPLMTLNMKLRGALMPTVWYDGGILAPNALVLIVVFALRLSAGR